MSPALPGKIPGLLRRGSPVVFDGASGLWSGSDEFIPSDGAAPFVAAYPSLDLADATGRAHAAWWLFRTGCVTLTLTLINQSRSTLVDACAHLDPNDPRLLPDGSRWVDAEALRLVVLHVAGVTDE